MLLRIENLYKSFGRESVIAGLNYETEGKFFLTILGSSGCGKTTLLRMLSGVLKPDRGKVELTSERLGFSFQDDRLIPWLTAAKNVSIVAPECDCRKYLSLVGLSDHADKYPSQLSGGMRRRLNIARALAFEPDLILMDEPFNSLDVVIKERLTEDIAALWRESELSVVMVTHDPREAARLSSEIMVVQNAFKNVERFILGAPHERSPDEIDEISRGLLEKLKEFSPFVQ